LGQLAAVEVGGNNPLNGRNTVSLPLLSPRLYADHPTGFDSIAPIEDFPRMHNDGMEKPLLLDVVRQFSQLPLPHHGED